MMTNNQNIESLGDQLARLELQIAGKPSDADSLLEYAELLHRDGRSDEAFRNVKMAVAMDKSKGERARQLLHQFMSSASILTAKSSPPQLIALIRAGLESGVGPLDKAQLEALSVLEDLSRRSDIVPYLLKLQCIPLLFQVIFASRQSGVEACKLSSRGIINLLSGCDRSGIQSFADIDALLGQTDAVDSLLALCETPAFSPVMNALAGFFQIKYCQLLKDSEIPSCACVFLDSLLSGMTVDGQSIGSLDIAYSLMLKLWTRPEFCKSWSFSQSKLDSAIDTSVSLLQAKRIQNGHFAVVMRHLEQSCPPAEFKNNVLFCFKLRFRKDGSPRQHALNFLCTLFTANVELATSVFNEDGLLVEIMDCAEFESDEYQVAILELLSEACCDTACRTNIRANALDYLEEIARSSHSYKTLASLVLSKLISSDKKKPGVSLAGESVDTSTLSSELDLMKNLAQLILTSTSINRQVASSIEGLSYLSAKPFAKESIELNAKFIPHLQMLLKKSSEDKVLLSSCQYGIALICDNVTSYRRKKTDEEAQVQKLREFAKDVSPEENDPRDSDKEVQRRNSKFVDMGILAVLNVLSSCSSPRILEHVSKSWVNLARDPSLRGKLAQSGAIKSLLQITNTPAEKSAEGLLHDRIDTPNQELVTPAQHAAQAIAKIAISLDPHIAYPNTAHNLIRPLLDLLKTYNQLFQFEALLALTNLASMDETKVGSTAVSIRNKLSEKLALRKLEDLMLSDHAKVQCAATELICNLMASDTARLKWIAERGSTRVKILLALCDADDVQTRKAASGALAMLVSEGEAQKYMAEQDRAAEIMLLLLQDDDWEVKWRALMLMLTMGESKETLQVVIKDTETVRKCLRDLSNSAPQPQLVEFSKLLLQTIDRLGL
eukprot:Partr_v1_DN27715_c0_g1_i1_m67597 putative Unc-45 homolog